MAWTGSPRARVSTLYRKGKRAIVDVVPEADWPRAFNLQVWAFNLGIAVASGGADRYPIQRIVKLREIRATAVRRSLSLLQNCRIVGNNEVSGEPKRIRDWRYSGQTIAIVGTL
jgi:hypothetical protein